MEKGFCVSFLSHCLLFAWLPVVVLGASNRGKFSFMLLFFTDLVGHLCDFFIGVSTVLINVNSKLI